MFSRSCQYALQSTLYIHLHQGEGPVKIKDIAETQNIPIHFLGKVLQILVKHKILDSTKGPTGGFTLKKKAEDITLLDIVEVVDGLDIFDTCGIGLKKCSDENPCPIHNQYKVVRSRIEAIFDHKTIKELCEDVKNGEAIVSFKE